MSYPPGKSGQEPRPGESQAGGDFQKDRNKLPEVIQECLDVSNLPTTFLLGLRLR